MLRKICLMVVLLVLGTGCSGPDALSSLPTETAVEAVSPETASPTSSPTLAPAPTDTPTPDVTSTPSITPTVILPAQPREITFEAGDGVELKGLYYPPDAPQAPVLVLMHWARGDQQEWASIAGWVQNRGQVESTGNRFWESPGWFPDFPSELSLGVFTFTFRDCQGGCQGWSSAGWLLDARAAVEAAANLPGADPRRILTAGASIGADGAVDACDWWNEQGAGRCLGAFAISPGSYLTVPYEQAGSSLLASDPAAQVYCLFDRRDDAAWETCPSLPEATQVDFGYVHKRGMELIDPGLKHNTLILLREFIQRSLETSGG